MAENQGGAALQNAGTDAKVVYWRQEFPPGDAELAGEYTVEAVSDRVPGTIAHRDELWAHCYADLMRKAIERLEQEVERLGGRYAHVRDEAIESRHDDRAGETWLHGRFTYTLYRGR